MVTYDFTATGRTSTTLGAIASGSFSFDTTAAPTPSGFNGASYPLLTFEASVTGGVQDGGSYSTSSVSIRVEPADPLVGPGVVDLRDITNNGGTRLFITDTTGLFITSSAPPENLHLIPLMTSNNSLELIDSDLGLPENTGATNYSQGSGDSYTLVDVSLRTAVVPLPAGGGLLLVALAAVGVARRRTARR